MGLLDNLKGLFASEEEDGVEYECKVCGAQFETVRQQCSKCGSTEVSEIDAGEMRPQG